MILQNGDVLLTHPAEVSKQFYIMVIVFFLSIPIRLSVQEGSAFAFIPEKFPRINIEKLKVGIFDGPQIKELRKAPSFDEALSEAELSTGSYLSQLLQTSWETTWMWNTRRKLKSH